MLPSVTVRYEPRGAARDLFLARDTEVMLSGPAGTGKSRACFEKLHLCLLKYPHARALVLRKTLASLTASGLVTYREKVLHPLDRVRFFSGNKERPAQYEYPNGSVLVVGGLDKADKVMSTEYDLIYVQEATELGEDEFEKCTTRLRSGVMPYQQIAGDCNPGPPSHWIKKRADRGQLRMLESRHEDNPAYWDAAERQPTAAGARYFSILDALTGVRRQRLRLGIWAAAEGMVYDGWDPRLHVLDPFEIPESWRRYWVIDFGYTNPLVCQWWAEDPDGRLYRYREFYRTQTLVEDAAAEMLECVAPLETPGEPSSRQWREPRPEAIICDHDAEDRATLERHLQLPTIAASKAVSPGIQSVASRLKVAGDGRPRVFLLRDALLSRDASLDERKIPASTEEEVESYVWNTAAGRTRGEEPVKLHDHGMDCLRYMVAYLDFDQPSQGLW